MKQILVFTALMLVLQATNAQQTIGKLNPEESYTNTSREVIFYMPRSKVVKLLNCQTQAEFDSLRVEKYKELVKNMQMRIIESDSAISLRGFEADYWKRELDKNDRELEQIKIQNAHLEYENNRIRKSRIYYVLGGIVASSVVYIAVK